MMRIAVLSPPTDQHQHRCLYHRPSRSSSSEFELPASLARRRSRKPRRVAKEGVICHGRASQLCRKHLNQPVCQEPHCSFYGRRFYRVRDKTVWGKRGGTAVYTWATPAIDCLEVCSPGLSPAREVVCQTRLATRPTCCGVDPHRAVHSRSGGTDSPPETGDRPHA
jgi:hypothetical protein